MCVDERVGRSVVYVFFPSSTAGHFVVVVREQRDLGGSEGHKGGGEGMTSDSGRVRLGALRPCTSLLPSRVILRAIAITQGAGDPLGGRGPPEKFDSGCMCCNSGAGAADGRCDWLSGPREQQALASHDEKGGAFFAAHIHH